MKKIVILTLAITLMIPNIVFASWWNPLTWFAKQNTPQLVPVSQSEVVITTTTTDGRLKKKVEKPSDTTRFYIKYENSRLRSCPSIECDILGNYALNQTVDISNVTSLKDVDEWTSITTEGGLHGFFNKSVLSEAPVELSKHTLTPKRDQVEIQNSTLIKTQTEISQSNTSEDVSKYKNELHNFTSSLHKKISSIKEIISIEITFANNVSDTIKSSQTSNSKSLTQFVEKVIPTQVKYLDASINLLDSIGRHVTKIENLIDSAEYAVVLDIYHKSLITDQEDIMKVEKDIKTSSNKFNDTMTQVDNSLVKTRSSVNKSSPLQSSGNIQFSTDIYSTEPIPAPKDYYNPHCSASRGDTVCPKYDSTTIIRDTRLPPPTTINYNGIPATETIMQVSGPKASQFYTQNINPLDYTIQTTDNGSGGLLYKPVAPQGINVSMGYYKSETEAVEAYKTWLSNNGY